MNPLLDQFRTFLAGLQPGQRTVLFSALALAAMALVGVGWWSWGEQWETVYSGANPEEVQSVAEVLDEQKIAYRIAEDGRSIEVKAEDKGRARIYSASAGRVMGFEILDAVQLGTSPQRERWAFQRALQGELARTISTLDEVEWARVHLVLAERSAFLRDERPPSASVTVGLRPNVGLSATQIRGVTALVAGAVDGLKANEVVLVDQNGALLAGGEQEEGTIAGMPALLALRTAEEKRTRAAIMEALVRVLGSPNDVTVGVTVDMETASVDQITRSQDPDTQVLISESIREEDGESTRPVGIPGTESNVPERAGAQGGPATTRNSSLEQRSNFAYTEVEKREVMTPGDIRRISVAVMVNDDRLIALARTLVSGGDPAVTPDAAQVEAKVAELRTQIEESARAAMGFDKERGDSVKVTFLPFSTATDATEVEDSLVSLETARTWLPYIVVLAALAAVFLLVVRPLVGAVARASAPAPALSAGGAAGALAGAGGRLVDGTGRETGRNLSDRLRNMVENFENVDAADLNRLVDLEQEATAQVLRRWIRDGQQ